MFGPLRFHLTRSARRLIVWCLLVSVPLYGLSGSLVTLLGSQHVHVPSIQAGVPAAQPHADAMPRPVAADPWGGLEDFRRLGSARQPVQHQHIHSDFERHHHEADDTTVVALDGGHRDGAGTDEGGSTTAAHVLALSDNVAFAMPTLPAFTWPASAASAVDPWIADGMERPPKA